MHSMNPYADETDSRFYGIEDYLDDMADFDPDYGPDDLILDDDPPEIAAEMREMIADVFAEARAMNIIMDIADAPPSDLSASGISHLSASDMSHLSAVSGWSLTVRKYRVERGQWINDMTVTYF